MDMLRWRPSAVGSAVLAVAVAVALTPALGAGTAHACSCKNMSSAEDQRRAFDSAAVIFKATLVKRVEQRNIYPRPEGEFTTLGTTYYFTPIKTYKGTTKTPQAVRDRYPASSCSLHLTDQGPYLVYAFRPKPKAVNKKLYTGLCGGMRKIAVDEEPTFAKPK